MLQFPDYLIYHRGDVSCGIDDEVMAADLLLLGLHPLINCPASIRPVLGIDVLCPPLESLPNQLGRGFHPDDDKLEPEAGGDTVEMLTVILDQVGGVQKHRDTLAQELFSEEMKCLKQALAFSGVIAGHGE